MQIEPTQILNKVQTGAVAGAITSILVFVLTRFGGLDLPADVIAAITTIVFALVAYVTPLMAYEVRFIQSDPVVLGNGGKVIAPVVPDDQSRS